MVCISLCGCLSVCLSVCVSVCVYLFVSMGCVFVCVCLCLWLVCVDVWAYVWVCVFVWIHVVSFSEYEEEIWKYISLLCVYWLENIFTVRYETYTSQCHGKKFFKLLSLKFSTLPHMSTFNTTRFFIRKVECGSRLIFERNSLNGLFIIRWSQA